jgi:hypothetical protein
MVSMTKKVEETLVRKVRRIPAEGELLVKVGEIVEPETVLTRGTVLNPDVREIRVYAKLGTGPEEAQKHMLKEEGDEVKRDEVLAIYRSFFSRFTKVCRSPIDGTIEALSKKTGRALIRGLPIPVTVKAHIPGKIVDVTPGEGATVETNAAVINGVFGVGGEALGELTTVVESPGEPLTTERIGEGLKGKVLIGGSIVTIEALRKASKIGVSGIVTGSVDQKDLTEFLGHEIGMGVTGDEDTNLTLIVTEGFGIFPMDDEIFSFLNSHEGYRTSIDGTTQIRQRMLRPEIVIPL